MHVQRALTWMVLVLACVGCGDDDADATTDTATPSGTAGVGGTGKGGAGGNKSTAGAGGKGTAGSKSYDDANDAGASDDSDGGVPNTAAAADYAIPDHWLCRPGHNQACDVDLDTTVVKADGTLEVQPFAASTQPAFDCFYVYPTVSLDTTPNSDLVPGAEELAVVRAQFARFASQCRLFAPLYRQVTLTALRSQLAGATATADRQLGYRDVLAAWQYYLEHDNAGRGVVLIGHSQGSSVLTQLLKEQLDKEPRDPRFISAILAGTNVLVPDGAAVGGTFQHIPLCKATDETGCALVYASFRADHPPTPTTLFATSTDANLGAACTNPAALGGGSAELHAYLSTEGPGASGSKMGDWVTTGTKITTPFVSVPGLLSAECKAGDKGEYLAITVHGDPSDTRTDEIVGDVVTNGEVQADWGLHLIDVHLAMGNLLDLVRSQATAQAAK